MKKKLILLLLGFSIAVSGCGGSKGKGYPVLGDSTRGYDGYEYLYDDVLTTESEENSETKKMESKELVVYLPKSDYNSVNRTMAYSEKMGVSINLILNPTMRHEEEDFLLTENLEYYFNSESEYEYESAQELEKTEVKGNDKKAKIAATYCKYDEYEEKYNVYSDTYYMVRLKNKMKLLVKVTVKESEVTGKTEDLIEELEKFYGFNIEWNQEEAQEKLEKMEGQTPSASSNNEKEKGNKDSSESEEKNTESTKSEEETNSNSFMNSDDFKPVEEDDKDTTSSSGKSDSAEKYIKFDLPEGWKEDVNDGDDLIQTYAPNGDSSFADQYFAINKMEVGPTDDALESGIEEMKRIVAEAQNIDKKDINATKMETKCMGEVYYMDIIKKGQNAKFKMYIGGKNGNLYAIVACSSGNGEVFNIVNDILENGQVQ
ncbi:hypothetical protein [Anaerosacchariphilus polymeriproducens]|uniref:PsbP C-terminal domain-containing protein n=1 Tax=Anaerosacchariphilus polymeriproducens TaxID=1812858 RepID=A0A371AVQ3_9FIRM|nr:hypothetical protein [Anaerosacchariphilus polymeriproducens]RDU23612.1 hypothetical protein DWV06_08495 [Anaerosacchariphilus polymeriproducens]